VRRAFSNGFDRIAVGMTTHTRLGPNGRILVVDRIRFLEITRRCMTGIALPTVGIHCGMHGIRRMALG